MACGDPQDRRGGSQGGHPDTSVALVVSESACRMSSPPGPVSDLCVSVAHLRSLQGEITSQIASQISPGLA